MAKSLKKPRLKKPAEILKYDIRLIMGFQYSFVIPKKPFDFLKKEFLKYDVTPKIGVDGEKDIIGITLRIVGKIIETEEITLESEDVFEFNVPGLKNHVIINENRTWRFINSEHAKLLNVLMGITYSTMRGVLLERTRGTILETTFLPIIDPGVLVPQPTIKK